MKPVARHRYTDIGPVDLNKPTAGHYRMKLVRGGPWIAVRLWFGPPLDPETHEPLDRSHRWYALRDGREVEVHHVWPSCAVEPITEAEYGYMLAASAWDRQHDPLAPASAPDEPIDLLHVQPPRF